MSQTLTITFTAANGQLACLQGSSAALTWKPLLRAWTGDDFACSPQIHIELVCAGTVFTLSLDNVPFGNLSGVCGPATDLVGSGTSAMNPPGIGSAAYVVTL